MGTTMIDNGQMPVTKADLEEALERHLSKGAADVELIIVESSKVVLKELRERTGIDLRDDSRAEDLRETVRFATSFRKKVEWTEMVVARSAIVATIASILTILGFGIKSWLHSGSPKP